MSPKFSPGNNIAMKVPIHEFDATIEFYRDILGFKQIDVNSTNENEAVIFKFGDKNLWIDKMAGISQAEIWLEVITDNIETASKYFEEKQCIKRDDIEPLPPGFKGFWLSNPSNIIHLINE